MNPATQQHERELAAFSQHLRARHVRLAASHAAMRVLLAWALPAIALSWLWPAGWQVVLGVVLGAAVLAAAFAAVRASRVANQALLAAPERDAVDDPQLVAELGDELATWLETRGASATPMHAWLARDVAAKVPALTPATLAAFGRRRLGELAWIVPLVLLLLIAWFLAELLAPPWPGVLGGRQQSDAALGGGGDGNGKGGNGDGRGAGGGPAPGDERREAPRPPPAAANPPPAKPDQPAESSTVPPPPLLAAPELQRFVVPEFVGDGPTRRARMHVAEIEDGAPAGAASRPAGPEPTPAPPPPLAEQFARAAERALASRHVPPPEQGMVKNYFDALQQAARKAAK